MHRDIVVAVSPSEALYRGSPPWEIGRPQPTLDRLLDGGGISGDVLDVGCGTGENALALAARGFDVTGIDVSATAIRVAEEKARGRAQAGVRFVVATRYVLQANAQGASAWLASIVYVGWPASREN